MLHAAFRYFLLIFGLSFLFGTARIMLTGPAMGQTAAHILELPAILIASLLVARQSLVMYKVTGVARALGVGLLAFVMLMAAEMAVALLIYRQLPLVWAASLIRWPNAIGFAGQISFALFPAFIALTRTMRFRL